MSPRLNRWKPVPFFQALAHHVRQLREVEALDGVVDDNGRPVSEDRLLAGLCIGEENGDLVFLDLAKSGAVYMFHHDGGDIEKLASSFGAWLKRIRPYRDDDDD